MSERERERRRRFDSSRRSAPTSSRTAAGAPFGKWCTGRGRGVPDCVAPSRWPALRDVARV